MFIGHFALGLAAKKIAPKTSLGTLMLSTVFVDELWPFFVLLGWEHVRIDPGNTAFTPMDFYDYPWSHSLLMTTLWAGLFGWAYWAKTRYRRGAWVVAAGVLSHWVLDWVTHRPDLPLWPGPGSPTMGLGLWNSVAATLAVEIPLYLLGIGIYLRATRAKDRVGSYGLGAFLALLFALYLGNAFGPPPPSAEAIGYMGPVTAALFALPYWIDRHRTVNPS